MKNPNVAIFSFAENRHESVLTCEKNAVREINVFKRLSASLYFNQSHPTVKWETNFFGDELHYEYDMHFLIAHGM